MNMFARCARK